MSIFFRRVPSLSADDENKIRARSSQVCESRNLKKNTGKFFIMAAIEDSNASFIVKWAGKEYAIDNLAVSSTVKDLKFAIQAKTNVLPERQKLLNLRFKGKETFKIHIFFLYDVKKSREKSLVQFYIP